MRLPDLRGGRISRQRVGEAVGEAAALATAASGRAACRCFRYTTPHKLRRTYISIALLANGFDVESVMSQVGHADSKMTLDVYAQFEQRAERSPGTSFDALIRRAGTGHEAPSDADRSARAPPDLLLYAKNS